MKASAGIFITQAGVDMRHAADYQYVFNSNWPSLQIAVEVVVTVPANTASFTIPHNLGFYPLVMVWTMSNGISKGRAFDIVSFDKKNIYITIPSYDDRYSIENTYSIKCYNLDISKPVNYELPKPPLFKNKYDPSTGIKIVKYGKSLASTDLRDFILHSRCQSPAVLTILTQEQGKVGGGTNSIQYINPAGYTPWVLGFISPFGDNTRYRCFAPNGNQASPAFFQIGSKSVVWTAGTSGNGSMVVLRDPLVIPNTRRVIY